MTLVALAHWCQHIPGIQDPLSLNISPKQRCGCEVMFGGGRFGGEAFGQITTKSYTKFGDVF